MVFSILENLLEAEYTGTHEDMEEYTRQIENEFTHTCNKNSYKSFKFWKWFMDNYNNIEMWNTIDDNMKPYEEDDSQ